MLDQQTIQKLHIMKLTGMAEAFQEQSAQPDMDRLSFAERFGLIVDRQWTWKEDCRLQRYLKNAKLKLNACVEDIDYKASRGIDQSVMMKLITCDWIRKHQNIIITGPTGAGKTFIACALANKACREGYRSFYIRSPRFSYQMSLARGDGSYGNVINKLSKAHVLRLTIRPCSLTDTERRDPGSHEERHGHTSTIVVSQLPMDHWHEQIGDPRSPMPSDRLIHNAHK